MKVPTSSSLGPLSNHSVVVIIGGGPAGAACAIALKKLARGRGISPRIVVYEGKIFEKKSYYNQCLGVLSPPLDKIMTDDLGLPFPYHLVQRQIDGYVIHTDTTELLLAGEHQPSYACRRVEFDDYLFQQVKELGIEVYQARVTEIEISSERVMVFTEVNNIRADVVVGAFGLDEGLARVFEWRTPYRQPHFLYSVVTKIHPGDEAIKKFGNYIHAFLLSAAKGVEFGAITPKGNHLSLNIAGKKIQAESMENFLNLPQVRKTLPPTALALIPELYYFKGKFPTSPGRGIIGDRYVMIGDAAGLNRPFKGKGINSALITGINAARVMVEHGISRKAFTKYLEYCQELRADIPYGIIFRELVLLGLKLKLLNKIIAGAKYNPRLKQAFFDIVSGQNTYRNIWKQTKSFRLLYSLVQSLLGRKA